jgi:hypothetical protein
MEEVKSRGGGEVSHKYLHTHYTPRGDYLV